MKALQISTPFLPVSPDLYYAGTERVVYTLEKELNYKGFSSGVVAPDTSLPCGKLHATLKKPIGEEYVIDSDLTREPSLSKGVYSRLEHIAKALEYANSIETDIVHIHDDNMLAFGNLIKKPSVMTLHTYLEAFWNPESHDFVRNPKTKLIAISQSQKKIYESKGIPVDYVVHHGVDRDLFEIRKKLPFVFIIGNIHPMKGQMDAIEAARFAEIDLVIAGSGAGQYSENVFSECNHDMSYRPEFDRFLESFNDGMRKYGKYRIYSLGLLNDKEKKPYFASARALLFPTKIEEPFGLVMIEAMMSGTPVIAYNKGSVPEIIEEGKTGFIVNNAREMALAIKKCLSINPKKCRKIAIERFSKEKMAENYIRVYQDILNKNR